MSRTVRLKKKLLSAMVLLVFFTTTLLSTTAFAIDLSNEKTIYTVATAHLDTQWNWDVKTTINNYISKTLVNNFNLFEKYPDYNFSFEGAFRYALMKEYYPEQYQQMKDYIAQGRWHVTGSSWDAGDVNVPSSEALMRNILYGNEYFKDEFGKTSTDIFLPDCFGFGYTLPSIAHHMGLKGFSTQKLSWGSAFGIPFDIGRWYGVDGNYVLAALNPGSYSSSVTRSVSTDPTWVDRVNDNGSEYGLYAAYKYYGTGDTGGSPTDGSVNYVQQDIEKGFDPTTGIQVLSAPADQIFRDITPEQASLLPSWDNELLMTTHGTGCYTSRTISKRWNRQNELLADATERAGVMADWLGGAPYPKEKLDEAWKRFIWHQFHDDLTGTSLPSAYMISWNDYVLSLNQFAEELTNGVGAIANAMDTSASGIPVVVYNPVSKARKDVVEAKVTFPAGVPEAVRVYDPDGNEVPSQLGAAEGDMATVLFLADMPSMGFKTYDIVPSESPCSIPTGLEITGSTLENDSYRVTVNSDGDISGVYDKVHDRELLAAPSRLEILDDNSTTWPSWEIMYHDVTSAPKAYVSGPAEIEIVEEGPVRVSLKIKRKALGSTYEQVIRLTAGDDKQRVDIDNKVGWYTKAANLKAAFPLAVSNSKATYDLGLGTIQRGNNTSSMYEVPAQQWADLTDTSGEYGVSILNDCKYGWDKPDDNTLRLTLIHTPEGAYGGNHQDTQDFGENRFTYSIYGHAGDWADGDTVTQAEGLNQPLKVFQTVSHTGSLGKEASFLNVSHPNVTVKAVKLAENGSEYIVRLQETSGNPSSGILLSVGDGIESAREVNGAEDPVGAAAVEDGKLRFDIGKYEPKTFALTLAEPSAAVGAPVSEPVELPYNKDVVTFNGDKEDGALDALENSIPAELLPDSIVSGGIEFETGPRTDGRNNAVACGGQEISIPAGYGQVYLLAASTAGDTEAEFKVNGDPVRLNIQDYKQYVGQWDLHAEGITGYIKRDPVAWAATHTHNPNVTTPSSPIPAPGNSAYDFIYMFKYRIDLPEGENTITLPDDEDILVFAMTASDNGNGNTVPAGALYDEKVPPALYKLTVVNGTGSGYYPEGVTVEVAAAVPVGYTFKEWTGPVADSYSPVTTVTVGTEPVTVTAVLNSLGTNIALGKTATASSFVNGEGPEKTVDGSSSPYSGGNNSKWCATGSGDKWLKLDLGQEYAINRWIVRHAGDGGESPSWNTRDFKLQRSDDGSAWTDVDIVTNNTANITDRVTNPFTARYVRLYITKPTNTSDSAARIYEIELYAYNIGTLVPLTVIGGTGSGEYPEGSEISVSATIPEGYFFRQWTGPVADPYSVDTTVTMGSEPVTVQATFARHGSNLALNKPVTASGYVSAGEAPGKAVDGIGNTKWCHNTPDFPDKWLSVDLGQEYTIERWVVKHAGFGGENTSWNTRDFKLQRSDDGSAWTDVDVVSGNTANVTNRVLDTPFTARYVRLVTMAPTSSSDPAARIYEFELYAPLLSDAELEADDTVLERNQTAGIALTPRALTYSDEAVDLIGGDPVVEYFSSTPDAISVKDGVIMAKNTGTSQVYAEVTIDGVTVESNKIDITVTVSCESIRRLIDGFEESGELSGPLVPQLVNSLKQTEKFYNEMKLFQAVKHMQNFIKHLNNPPMDRWISDETKEILNLDAFALIGNLAEKMNVEAEIPEPAGPEDVEENTEENMERGQQQ